MLVEMQGGMLNAYTTRMHWSRLTFAIFLFFFSLLHV
jgi:hypothetical protein